jgi:hypothetical protein
MRAMEYKARLSSPGFFVCNGHAGMPYDQAKPAIQPALM